MSNKKKKNVNGKYVVKQLPRINVKLGETCRYFFYIVYRLSINFPKNGCVLSKQQIWKMAIKYHLKKNGHKLQNY